MPLRNARLPVVFDAAKRRCGNAALAEEVAQLVFIDFAKRMPSLQASDRIGSWLHRASVFRANDVMKSEHRGKAREQQAATMMELERLTQTESWQALSPVMDQALNGLRTKDREVIVLHHLEGDGIADLASKLGIRESAAKKRLERAMERLRAALRGRGIAVAIPLLMTLLPDKASASTVSAAFVDRVSAVSLTKLASAGPAVWWFRYWPIPRFIWMGAATTLMCGVWPMIASLQEPAFERQPAAVEGTLTDMLVRRATASPPVPPTRPLIREDMTVPEIVEVLAKLYARPLTSLDEERCRLLWKQIPEDQAKEALLLIDEIWPASTKRLCDKSNIHSRSDLCAAWLKHDPDAAVSWAVARLRPGADEYVNRWQWCRLAARLVEAWVEQDWDTAWPWVQAGIADGSLLIADDRMDLLERIGVHLSEKVIQNLGTHAAIDALTELQNHSPPGNGNSGALGGLATYLRSDEDFQYMMQVISNIASQAARVALRESVARRWSRRHRESAMAWVESLEFPGERSRFALDLAFPYVRDEETPPNYRALVEWWQSLDSSPGRVARYKALDKAASIWMRHDPRGLPIG